MQQDSLRWKDRAVAAALAARWHTVTRDLLIARAEYLAQLEADVPDVSTLRKTAQRLHDLQQQSGVLSRELQEQGPADAVTTTGLAVANPVLQR